MGGRVGWVFLRPLPTSDTQKGCTPDSSAGTEQPALESSHRLGHTIPPPAPNLSVPDSQLRPESRDPRGRRAYPRTRPVSPGAAAPRVPAQGAFRLRPPTPRTLPSALTPRVSASGPQSGIAGVATSGLTAPSRGRPFNSARPPRQARPGPPRPAPGLAGFGAGT